MPTLIAALQMNSRGDVAANLATASDLVKRAADRGAELAGLPENFAFLGTNERDKLAMQEALDGPIVTAMQELARRCKIALILGGFQERSEDPERPYNSSIAIDSHGEIRAVYRKIHLFDVDLGPGCQLTESRHTQAGTRVEVVEMVGLRFGLSICYDLRFSALYGALVDAGAQVLTVPAAFTLQTGKDHWELLLRARAVEFQSYVMAPAQEGYHNERRHSYGHAMIADPWGIVVARCSDGAGFCIAEIDERRVDAIRTQLPALQHRRADLFS